MKHILRLSPDLPAPSRQRWFDPVRVRLENTPSLRSFSSISTVHPFLCDDVARVAVMSSRWLWGLWCIEPVTVAIGCVRSSPWDLIRAISPSCVSIFMLRYICQSPILMVCNPCRARTGLAWDRSLKLYNGHLKRGIPAKSAHHDGGLIWNLCTLHHNTCYVHTVLHS